MHYIPFSTTYYLDVALMRAGEAAEVLWCRARAWCGDQETDGVVPREILPRLAPTRAAARARALVEAGLWVEVPVGWQFVRWDAITKDELDQQRESGRVRQRRHRDKHRNGVTDAVSNGVTNGEVTGEKEGRKERSAAAAADTPPPPRLPEPVEILRGKLEARKLVVRWDRATPADLDDITALVSVHGDEPLVRSAVQSFRPDSPPAFVSAWLAQWRALPPPGTGLHAVPDDPCPQPGHSGTTRHCTQCASEQLAGGDR